MMLERFKVVGAIGVVLALAAAGAIAYATTYTMTNTNVWSLTLASRPAHLPGTLVSTYYLGKCVEKGGVNCPHNGEEGPDTLVSAVAKTGNGTPMAGWDWVKCGAMWDEAEGANTYWMIFGAPAGTWPTALPTGCAGGPCPQWPATLTCSVVGDDPPGPDDWTGHSASYTVTLGPAVDPNWVGNPISTIALATGKTLTMKTSASGNSIGAARFVYHLPAGSYMDGTVQARKSDGSVWAGVKCTITENGSGTADTIEYSVGEYAVEHTGGYCTINGTNSPVNVVRE